MDPYSKIDDFVLLVEGIPEDIGSVAFFKFCYVDMGVSTNVDEVFTYYKEQMVALRDSMQNSKIVLVTVPLTSKQAGLKAFAKKVLGRHSTGHLDNMNRSEFNERMINELSGDFPIFDLAGVESTLPDGSKSGFKYEGREYPSMYSGYTTDGGHLNDFGAKIVAFNLLAFLAEELD